MIEPDRVIRFSPQDVPDIPEIKREEGQPEEKQEPRSETPEPEGWKPIGAEW